MKNPEVSALTIEILDRNVRRILDTSQSDWTIFWTLEPFLQVVRAEPALVELVADFRSEWLAVLRVMRRQLESTVQQFIMDQSAGVDGAPICIIDDDSVHQLIGAAPSREDFDTLFEENLGKYDVSADNGTSSPAMAKRITALKIRCDRILFAWAREEACHPGAAFLRLERDGNLNFSESDRAESHNRQVELVRKAIVETERWRGADQGPPQSTLVRIQEDVKVVHLALVTSLLRGGSRRAVIRRYAARCESYDRGRLMQELASPEVMPAPEAFLTLDFARYLFDSGFNPLVDAAACGLRPDVLDATSTPAFYVEAKQYENVDEGTPRKLRRGLLQTLNTWERLAKRWHVPEAFLLVFRRSGQPLSLDTDSVRCAGGRLYCLVVDLAAPAESGSRARKPIRVDLNVLIQELDADRGSRKRHAPASIRKRS